MSDVPSTEVAHPSGMRRLDFAVWVSDADMDYITGALVERGDTWETFVKDALLEWASH